MSYKKVGSFACSPATQRGQSTALSADPKGQWMVYCNGRTVVMRSFADPKVSSEYTEHTCAASVARYSPSGYYIASGDVQGNVRIWDTVNEEHILKFTMRPLSGKVCDVAWDAESKRLIAVGEGKERFGLAFSYDSGTTCGDIVGHSKVSNSAHIRAVRPYKAATCSDDMTVNFYQGPPYKFVKSSGDHTRFVQCVRFSPDGAFLATAGSDAKIILYDGNTGEKISELTDGAHTGGVMAISWSPDSKQLVSSSLDMSVKIWDIGAKRCLHTVAIGTTVDDQQVGNVWAGQHVVSIALNGDLHYIDSASGKLSKTVYGHQKSITAFALDAKNKKFYTGSYDGRMFAWDWQTGMAMPIAGNGHTSQVAALSLSESGKLVSVGYDDVCKSVDVKGKQFSDADNVATEGQPKCVASVGDLVIIGTNKEVAVVRNGKKLNAIALTYSANAVAVSVDTKVVAVGGDDKKVHLFDLQGDQLKDSNQSWDANRGAITALAYSPDGKYLAAADTDRKIVVYSCPDGQVAIEQWVFHSAKVNCVAWAADSKHACSGGLDRDLYVWSVERPMKYICVKGAHQEGVSGVAFLDDTTVVSVGADASIKTWQIVHH